MDEEKLEILKSFISKAQVRIENETPFSDTELAELEEICKKNGLNFVDILDTMISNFIFDDDGFEESLKEENYSGEMEEEIDPEEEEEEVGEGFQEPNSGKILGE